MQKGIGLDTESIPCGPIASLRRFQTSGGFRDAYYDKDLNAAGAIFELYLKRIEISRTQFVLSMVKLGLHKTRIPRDGAYPLSMILFL